ncbi:MAG: DUF488 family protein [Actinobacteria bacterium]|nr:DUF488 family protein [Actinomycetota bacterium]
MLEAVSLDTRLDCLDARRDGPPRDPIDRRAGGAAPSCRGRDAHDVRRFPGSRHHPQFNKPALADSLAAAGFDYRHSLELAAGSLASLVRIASAASASQPFAATRHA